jgi:hypothetical protein
MSVKFKLGFTIDSEMLFGVLSKLLPIEDLRVEELAPTVLRELRKADLPELLHSLRKPKRAPQVRHKQGSGYAVNVYAGSNAIVMAHLADGAPHKLTESYPALAAAGYSTNGMFGRVERLVRHGYLVKVGSGVYELTQKGKTAWAERPFPELALEDRV